jgi:hypothetical protein
MAAEERTAEYREALRNLRQAQAAKSPNRALLEVIFRMRETAEYLRAVVAAAMDPVAPLAADHRKPDLINAINAVIEAANAAVAELRQGSLVIDVTPETVPTKDKLLEPTIISDSDQQPGMDLSGVQRTARGDTRAVRLCWP